MGGVNDHSIGCLLDSKGLFAKGHCKEIVTLTTQFLVDLLKRKFFAWFKSGSLLFLRVWLGKD